MGRVCNCVVVNTDRQEAENSGTGTAKVEVKFKFILDDSQIELKRRKKIPMKKRCEGHFFKFKIEIWLKKLALFYKSAAKKAIFTNVPSHFVSDRYL